MIPFRDDVPAKRYPVVTISIILANCLVFLYQLQLQDQALKELIFQFGVIPSLSQEVSRQPALLFTTIPLTMITSTFLHGGWVHLIGNMWYLWIFGDNVEDRMGHFRFLLFYVLCGLAAAGTHIFFNPTSTIPTIGASGAVAGVLGAYLVSYPFARILTIIPLFLLWPILELPAILVLGGWFLLQLLQGSVEIMASPEAQGGIAWLAHAGGFIAGAILIRPFATQPVQRYSW